MVGYFRALIGNDPALVESEYLKVAVEPDAPTDREKRIARALAREKYPRVAMLFLVDCSLFGELLSSLQNDYIKVNYNYPSDILELYNMCNHYIRNTK